VTPDLAHHFADPEIREPGHSFANPIARLKLAKAKIEPPHERKATGLGTSDNPIRTQRSNE
jgi:hypothetical protein